MWLVHLSFSAGDALSNAPSSRVSSCQRTARSADAKSGSPRAVLWIARWRRLGIAKRLGKVCGTEERVPSVGTDDVSAEREGECRCEFCHVLMWHGKARVTQ